MDAKVLSGYRMNNSESQIWFEFQKRIISDCQRVKVPLSFGEFIKRKTNSIEPYTHTAGYRNTVGYFYIIEGDRGELFWGCRSQNCEDIRWYVMEKILTHVGQKLEYERRKDDEKNWRYPRNFKNGKLIFEENENWIYDAVHDSRKYWFEYAIGSLAQLFEADRILPYVTNRVNLMNRWFYVPHWDFSFENMCFVEISDSKEHS